MLALAAEGRSQKIMLGKQLELRLQLRVTRHFPRGNAQKSIGKAPIGRTCQLASGSPDSLAA
jgi:hypothetical protein